MQSHRCYAGVNRSYDLVFSNWLLMYLEDAELKNLFSKLLRWLRPNGYLFFRESCYHSSGVSTMPPVA